MRFDKYDVTMLTVFNIYAHHGDSSDISRKEQKQFDQYMKQLVEDSDGEGYHIGNTGDIDEFGRCEITGVWGQVEHVKVMVGLPNITMIP